MPSAARAPRQYRFTRPRAEPVQVDAIESDPLDRAPAALAQSRSADGRQGLVVVIEDGETELMAGSEHVARVRVRNTGTIVERVDLRIDGSPREWATFEPSQLNIDQGGEQVAVLRFAPPREASILAGPALYDVYAWSLSNPSVRVAAHGRVTVQPFSLGSVSTDGLITESRRAGDYVVTVANRGNVHLVATVDAHDEPGALRIHTSRYEVQVPPGASTSFQMDVRPKRRLIVGTAVEHRLSVVVTPHGGTPLRADTTFRQKAYLPRWAPKAAVIGLVVTGLALALPVKRWFETRPRPVPGVVGRTEADAREQLREAGFKVDVKPVFDPAPEGQIASQEPSAGRDLSGGATVAILLSRGPAPVKVPKLSENATLSLATKLFTDAGLGVRAEREENEEVPRDQVLRVEPKEGTEVKPGEVITVTVSNGPKQIAVPTLTNLSRADVITTLTAKGLDFEFEEIERTDTPPDRVYAQSPVPGEKLSSGKKVTVFITPPAPPSAAPPIILPPTPPGTGAP